MFKVHGIILYIYNIVHRLMLIMYNFKISFNFDTRWNESTWPIENEMIGLIQVYLQATILSLLFDGFCFKTALALRLLNFTNKGHGTKRYMNFQAICYVFPAVMLIILLIWNPLLPISGSTIEKSIMIYHFC